MTEMNTPNNRNKFDKKLIDIQQLKNVKDIIKLSMRSNTSNDQEDLRNV